MLLRKSVSALRIADRTWSGREVIWYLLTDSNLAMLRISELLLRQFLTLPFHLRDSSLAQYLADA